MPICPTLRYELDSWPRDSESVITYYGAPLTTSEFFDTLREEASVPGSPNVLRHTVRTWLAELGVPDSDADLFMGHKSEGSATGKRYTHGRPEYLLTVSRAIEALFAALTPYVTRGFAVPAWWTNRSCRSH